MQPRARGCARADCRRHPGDTTKTGLLPGQAVPPTRKKETQSARGPHHLTFISRPSSHTSTIFRAFGGIAGLRYGAVGAAAG
jgi:hypothetical protein